VAVPRDDVTKIVGCNCGRRRDQEKRRRFFLFVRSSSPQSQTRIISHLPDTRKEASPDTRQTPCHRQRTQRNSTQPLRTYRRLYCRKPRSCNPTRLKSIASRNSLTPSTLTRERLPTDGNFFVDQDPAEFLKLVSFLRMTSNLNRSNRKGLSIPSPPVPTEKFCRMLEHYDLMPAVYPTTWDGKTNEFDLEQEYGSFTFSNVGSVSSTSVTVVHDNDLRLTYFEARVQKSSTAWVGWRLSGDNFFHLDLGNKRFYCPGNNYTSIELDMDNEDILVECTYDPSGTLKICVPTHETISSTVAVDRATFQWLVPSVCFSRKVTVQNIEKDFI